MDRKSIMFPLFRKSVGGCVCLTDTNAARLIKAQNRKWTEPENYNNLRIAAQRQCKEAGGDENQPTQWMGFLRIQLGAFRGETYRWMLENTPGYCGWLVNKMERETLRPEDPLFMHSMAFKKYVRLFPEGREIIALKAKKTAAASTSKQQTTTLGGAELGAMDEMDNVGDDELVACLESCEGSVEASGETREVVKTDPETTREPVAEQTQESVPKSTKAPTAEPTQQLSSQGDDIPLTKKWKKTLPAVDQGWISKTFFHYATRGPQFDFNRVTKLWYDPPRPSLSRGVLNKQECFFGHRMFLWMPRHLFQYQFVCPHSGCHGILVNNGVHQKTRMVLDVHDYYIIVGEDYECNKCKRRIISWSQSILDQLDTTERSKFPCILTDRYACDLKIVRMMRQRTLGNSSSLVFKQIAENHGETYLNKCQQYATNFLAFKKSAARGLVTIPAFEEPPPVMDIPRHRWFMKVYQLDVISRLDYELAELTSITGNILKIDSTKKITNKLAGQSRGTAMWATNVANEHGQLLMSVLTEGEGEGLRKMLDGIVSRYRNAGIPPPKVLYTDRDCCGRQCIMKYFDAWPFLNVRLDSWHFMRRFPNGCTTDKHQLYGPFMGRLSRCIFKIDEQDYALLMRAKRQELALLGVTNPSENDVIQHITTDEVARHCKRATRGINETTTLIRDLIASLDGEKGLDSSGVPLIDSVKMLDIWAKQSEHVACLQDPPGVRLYTQVSSVKKGGIDLPVYKCARGSTSLENFHLHMARFIPGTLAKDTNFQVYLLDGIFRWNADRGAEAITSHYTETVVPRTYSGHLKHQTNMLWQELCGKAFFPNFKPPAKYTGELVGVQYLYDQTGQELPGLATTREQLEDDDDVDKKEEDLQDEGFVEMELLPIPPPEESVLLSSPEETMLLPTPKSILPIPSDVEYRQLAGLESPNETAKEMPMLASNVHTDHSLEGSSPADHSSDVLGPDNIPGYDKVLNLAEFLVELREEKALRFDKVQRLIYLWEQLSGFDQKRTIFPRRFTKKPWSGKFGGRGKHVAPGVESITKVLLGPNKGPAQWPNCNRYTEATCELLLKIYPGDQKREGHMWTRWRLVLRAFHNIRQVVLKSQKAMEKTDIQLPLLNKKTLQQWYNKEDKAQEKKVLLQGLNMPKPAVTGSGLPEASQKPSELPSIEEPRFSFPNPTCTAGQAHKKISRKRKAATPVTGPSACKQSIAPISTSLISYPVIMDNNQLIILSAKSEQQQQQQKQQQKQPSELLPQPLKRKYKTPEFIKCSKCGQNRKNSITHRSYMFKIFCQNSERLTFEEWRETVKKQMDEERKLKKKN